MRRKSGSYAPLSEPIHTSVAPQSGHDEFVTTVPAADPSELASIVARQVRKRSKGGVFFRSLLLWSILVGIGIFVTQVWPSLKELDTLKLKAHALLVVHPELHHEFKTLAGEPLPTAMGERLSVHQVDYVLSVAGFPEAAKETMRCIALKESSFDPSAENSNRNKTRDTGLFQINDRWLRKCGLSRMELLNPETNAKCAFTVWSESGYNAWSSYPKRVETCLQNGVPQELSVAAD